MAQSVERRLGKAEVTGSIPVSSFFKLNKCFIVLKMSIPMRYTPLNIFFSDFHIGN